jgi:hypothetical protein
MAFIYSVRLEPHQEGMRHTIPNEIERLTQASPGLPYLFREVGRPPEEMTRTVQMLGQVIAESQPDNYIQIEIDDQSVLHLETGSCRA